MKKWTVLVVVLAALAAGWWLLRQKPVAPQARPNVQEEPSVAPEAPTAGVEASPKLRVVTSGYVAYSLAREIGGWEIDLSMLLPPGTEPHGYEPTPGAIIAVGRADVFIYVSARLEPWVKDVLAGAKAETTVVEAGVGSSDFKDPHVWMSPSGALEMAGVIRRVFAERDPGQSAYFQTHYDDFAAQMAHLTARYSATLATCKNKQLVHVGHLAFGNIADPYGLTLTALSGISHDADHSARQIADVVKLIRKENVKYIFTEEALSPALTQTIAKETGAKVLLLHTVEAVSKDDFSLGKSYRELMNENLENLAEGLQCQLS